MKAEWKLSIVLSALFVFAIGCEPLEDVDADTKTDGQSLQNKSPEQNSDELTDDEDENDRTVREEKGEEYLPEDDDEQNAQRDGANICAGLRKCDIDNQCTNAPFTAPCIHLPTCGGGSYCISIEKACAMECEHDEYCAPTNAWPEHIICMKDVKIPEENADY